MAKRQKRTPITGDEFGKSAGWFFAVPEAFREALDIKYTERKIHGRSIWDWTQGIPPQLSFDVGDVFYDRPDIRKSDWDRVRWKIGFAISVCAATSDRLSSGKIKPGSVEFDLSYFGHGRIEKTERFGTTQKEFMNFLRTGIIPGSIDLALNNENEQFNRDFG